MGWIVELATTGSASWLCVCVFSGLWSWTMSNYDFSQLSPHDFELLCRDLLQAEWKLTLESFKQGKDGGVDFRYARAGKNIIVQCKRFIETGFAGLLRELEKEAVKVRKLKPGRYVLMTAASLSDANKERIVEVIGSEFLEKADIYGRDDVNNLLGKHGSVERAHYKLWLASTNLLEMVLHSDVVMQTDFQVEKIHGEIKRYVQGQAYPRAMKTLNDDHIVILSGLPGVGKTTLANMLLYEHLSQGFEPVVIRQDFVEGKAMFRKNKPQVFYFDDFMGVTFLGDKGSSDQQREYRAILEFSEMVAKSKDKRLILTTREHLLRQAWETSEQIRHTELLDRKVVINMGDYSLRQRAEILYNHVFFSDLPPEYRDEVLKGEFYFKIVKHDKFNPRLIEWLSSFRRVRNVPVEGYQAFVARLLEDPSEIWRHAYEQQISDAGRSLLLAMFGFGGIISDAVLQEGFAALHGHRAQKYGFARRPNDYGAARAELHGAFVRPTPFGTIGFINPAVQDWLNSVVKTEPETAVDLVLGAARFIQIEQLWKFAGSDVGEGTRTSLAQQIGALVPRLQELAIAERAVPQPRGGTAFAGPTYEQRLATLMAMAEAMRAPALLPAIKAIIDRIQAEHLTKLCDISDTLNVIRQFDRSNWPEMKKFKPFFIACEAEVLKSAAAGCTSSELRELLSYCAVDDAAPSAFKPSLTEAYDSFVNDYFTDELSNCQSESDYYTLINDLEYFSAVLDVDCNSNILTVHEALNEYSDYEEQRADYNMDDYNEQRRIERASDDGIREMFGSLRSEA